MLDRDGIYCPIQSPARAIMEVHPCTNLRGRIGLSCYINTRGTSLEQPTFIADIAMENLKELGTSLPEGWRKDR